MFRKEVQIQVPTCISIMSLMIALTCGARCLGEDIGAGVMQGTYHVDRRGQRQFAGLFVAPELGLDLAPYLGVPVSLDATDVVQPINPGGAMITGVGRIERLPEPVALKIEWKDGDTLSTEPLRRVDEGESVTLPVTVTNQSGAELPLGIHSVYLGFSWHRPAGSSQNTYSPLDGSGRTLTVSSAFGNILPATDQTIDGRQLKNSGYTLLPENCVPLADGDSHSWAVTVENLPSTEYEVVAAYSWYDRKERRYLEFASNRFRLDVLALGPRPAQGLSVELIPGDDPQQRRIHFTNDAGQAVQFMLQKRGDVYDFSQDLLCYDRDGDLIPNPQPEGANSYEILRIEPGQSRDIPVEIPRETALARMVFFHRFVLNSDNADPDARPLGNEYVLSPHVLLSGGRE